MYAIIIGAGEIGSQVAANLCHRRNDVVVVEQDPVILDRLQERLDIMTVCGNGASTKVLTQAGIAKADMLMAITNNPEGNILACSLARHFDVPLKIARLRTDADEYFPPDAGLRAADFGVDQAIFPERECVANILDSLLRPPVRETVYFSHPDAEMVSIKLSPGSPLSGYPLREFPRPDLLPRLRVCAVLRQGELIIPRGDTGLLAGDEVYIAGRRSVVADLIAWAEPAVRRVRKVVIAGATRIGCLLAAVLRRNGMDICLVEPDAQAAHEAAEVLGDTSLILHAESTDASALEEGGIAGADAFIACHRDNETNILGCIIASRLGSGKIISVTNNADYVQIIAGMPNIDCCFSPLVAAVNALTRHIGTDDRRTVALLKRTPVEVMELTVQPGCAAAGQAIQSIDCPKTVTFALIGRGDDLVPAVGAARLGEGDQVVVMATPGSVADAERLFKAPRLLP